MDIFTIVKNNNFFNDALKLLTEDLLEYNNKNKWWGYLRRDENAGGRDYYDLIPVDNTKEDERDDLFEEILKNLDLKDYEWQGLNIDDVEDMLYEDEYDNLVLWLFDELN